MIGRQSFADLSRSDLTVPDNRVQAGHELRQALDFGGPTERACWTESWGEAALAALDRLADDYDGVRRF